MNTKVITIANIKDGVGKTASTAAIGDILARMMNKKVLVIDTTNHNDLSRKFGYDPYFHVEPTLDNLLLKWLNTKEDIREGFTSPIPYIHEGIINKPYPLKNIIYENLSIICSSSELNNVFLKMDYSDDSIVRTLLSQLRNLNKFDYILVDTAPSYAYSNIRDHFIKNSDYLLIPSSATKEAINGANCLIDSFIRTNEHSKIHAVNNLNLLGLFFCNVSIEDIAQFNHHAMSGDFFDNIPLLNTVIPKVTNTVNHGNLEAPITALTPNSSASWGYISLVREILSRIADIEPKI